MEHGYFLFFVKVWVRIRVVDVSYGSVSHIRYRQVRLGLLGVFLERCFHPFETINVVHIYVRASHVAEERKTLWLVLVHFFCFRDASEFFPQELTTQGEVSHPTAVIQRVSPQLFQVFLAFLISVGASALM